MGKIDEVLEAVVLGPEDRLVVFWPPYVTLAQLDEARRAGADKGFGDRVLHIAGADDHAVIRATRAAGSTVGACGDRLHVLGESVQWCHLAAGHTGAHSDGEATWSSVEVVETTP